MIRIQFFGASNISYQQQQVKLHSQQAYVLLALISDSPYALSRDYVAELFWPQHSQAHAKRILRTLLARINKQLPGLLKIDRNTLALQTQTSELMIDTLEFQKKMQTSTLNAWQQAISLYQGPFLAGVQLKNVSIELEHWMLDLRQFWHEQVLSLMPTLVNRLYEASPQEALACAQKWTQLDSFDDDAHYALIKLLENTQGKQAAVHHYTLYCQKYRTELGVDPDPRLAQLIAIMNAPKPPPEALSALLMRLAGYEQEVCELLTLVERELNRSPQARLEVLERILTYPIAHGADGLTSDITSVGHPSPQQVQTLWLQEVRARLKEA